GGGAAVVGAGIAVVAARRRAGAHARVTRIGGRAQVAVVALGAIRAGGVRADAGRGVARPVGVTLIRLGAHHRIGAHARPRCAAIDPGAGVAVVAGRSVLAGGVAAHAAGRIAGAGIVALVGRRTDHGGPTHTAARLARVGARAGVAVVARRAVLERRSGARAGVRVAGSGAVALVDRRAHER